MRENYNLLMKKEIENLSASEKPKLLLHCCCAPCASVPLVTLTDYFDVIAYYYNPNIEPQEEAILRADELQRFIEEYPFQNKPQYLMGTYENEAYHSRCEGLEKEPEGKKRCDVCFKMRFEEAAKLAKELGADYFTSTLSISPHKNSRLLHSIGVEMSGKYGIKYLPVDFKKEEGFKKSTLLSTEYNLYRQNYCGCIYSKMEMDGRLDEI